MNDRGLAPQDLEMIAAFIDRRLSEEERRAFQERLDREEALYEVFVETARYRDRQAAGPAVVVEHPAGRRRWGRLAAVAALVAAAVATPLLLDYLPGAEYAESLVAAGRFDPPAGIEWTEQGWRRMRGVSSLPEADAAFRVGVRALDLEIALRLGRDEDALALIGELEAALGSIAFSEVELAYAGRLRERLAAGAPPEELVELARAARESFPERFPDLGSAYRLGRWAEAGKLAARSGNRALLASRGFRRELERLTRPEERWEPPVVAGLETIAAGIGAPAEELDLAALETAFRAIIDQA